MANGETRRTTYVFSQPVERPSKELPDGWAIAEYAGSGGQAHFAVYANGRRMASGMTSEQSAVRWARLLAGAQPWPAA